MLEVQNIHQYYGGSHILRDVSLSAAQGQVTVLLGRNGVGKTTLLKSLMGLVPIRTGTIQFDGRAIQGATPFERARAGIGFVPQGREIFARLTVEENLRMGLAYKSGSTPIPPQIFELFPVLKQMINRMLSELDELGSQTGRFHESVGRYADVIERADTLESLAGAVREMVEESRTVQGLVDQTQRRLSEEHDRATDQLLRWAELRQSGDDLTRAADTDLAAAEARAEAAAVHRRLGHLRAGEGEREREEQENGFHQCHPFSSLSQRLASRFTLVGDVPPKLTREATEASTVRTL